MTEERKYDVTRRIRDVREVVKVIEREKDNGEVHKLVKPTGEGADGDYGHIRGRKGNNGTIVSVKRDVDGDVRFQSAHVDVYVGGEKFLKVTPRNPSLTTVTINTPATLPSTPETVLPAGPSVSTLVQNGRVVSGDGESAVAVLDNPHP